MQPVEVLARRNDVTHRNLSWADYRYSNPIKQRYLATTLKHPLHYRTRGCLNADWQDRCGADVRRSGGELSTIAISLNRFVIDHRRDADQVAGRPYRRRRGVSIPWIRFVDQPARPIAAVTSIWVPAVRRSAWVVRRIQRFFGRRRVSGFQRTQTGNASHRRTAARKTMRATLVGRRHGIWSRRRKVQTAFRE